MFNRDILFAVARSFEVDGSVLVDAHKWYHTEDMPTWGKLIDLMGNRELELDYATGLVIYKAAIVEYCKENGMESGEWLQTLDSYLDERHQWFEFVMEYKSIHMTAKLKDLLSDTVSSGMYFDAAHHWRNALSYAIVGNNIMVDLELRKCLLRLEQDLCLGCHLTTEWDTQYAN